jgi:hypothetical protein
MDLADLSLLASHNDGQNYLLNAFDAFLKYANSVPILSRKGEAVASSSRFVLVRTRGRKPLVVSTDRGKEFVNAKFRKLLDNA